MLSNVNRRTGIALTGLFQPNSALRNSDEKMACSEQVAKIMNAREIKAVLLDGSGTTMDAYVIAPAVAFVEAFKAYAILKLQQLGFEEDSEEFKNKLKRLEISMEEARAPMMLRKDLHIQTLYGLYRKDLSEAALSTVAPIKERWKEVLGSYPTLEDAQQTFKLFTPIQDKILPEYCEILKGAKELIDYCKSKKIATGFTTGFARSQVNIIEEELAKQGARLDVTVAGNEVRNGGRPSPSMVFKNMDELGLQLPHTIVKVDDTVGGVGEGLNAGMWAVAVANYSNYMNINSKQEARNIGQEELQKRREYSRRILEKSGAHYVIGDLSELPSVIADINLRMKKGPEHFPQSILMQAYKNSTEAQRPSYPVRSRL